MELNTLTTYTPLSRTLSCTLIASCMLLASCTQASSRNDISSVPQGTNTTVSDPTKDTAEPSLTNLLPTASANTPAPESKNSTSYLETKSENPSIRSEPEAEIPTPSPETALMASPKLFCRYQGKMNDEYYIIDYQISNTPDNHYFPSGQYNIRFYGNSPVFSSEGFSFQEETPIQEIDIPLDGYALGSAPDGLYIVDLNRDGMDDFILDLGISGQGKLSGALFFIYQPETKSYEQIANLCNATFYQDESVIYEYYPGMAESLNYKYQVVGNELILLESLTTEWWNFDQLPPEEAPVYPAYTYQKRIDGELVTVFEKAPKSKVDFSIWPEMDQEHRVK